MEGRTRCTIAGSHFDAIVDHAYVHKRVHTSNPITSFYGNRFVLIWNIEKDSGGLKRCNKVLSFRFVFFSFFAKLRHVEFLIIHFQSV